jgi:hypothetical protein
MRATAAIPAIIVLALLSIGCGSSGQDGDGPSEPAGGASIEPAASSGAEPGGSSGGGPVASLSGGAGAGWAAKPCDLLTTGEVGDVMGATDFASQAVTAQGAALCGYTSEASGSEVVLSVYEGDAALGIITPMQYIVDAGAAGVSRVDGIGELAVYSDDGTLALYDNGTAVLVNVDQSDATDAAGLQALAEDLARKVAERL